MVWLIIGLAIVAVGPCAGAAVVAAMVAWHEAWRAVPTLPAHRLARRAPTDLLDEYLDELATESRARVRRSSVICWRRADPEVLYEFLSQRAAAAPPARPANLATRLTSRPARLLPLTA